MARHKGSSKKKVTIVDEAKITEVSVTPDGIKATAEIVKSHEIEVKDTKLGKSLSPEQRAEIEDLSSGATEHTHVCGCDHHHPEVSAKFETVNAKAEEQKEGTIINVVLKCMQCGHSLTAMIAKGASLPICSKCNKPLKIVG